MRARSLAPRIFGDAAPAVVQPTHVMPIEGMDGALFVRDFSSDPERLVRVFDAAKGTFSPLVILGDEHVAGAYAAPGGVLLLTTSGGELCASKLDEKGRGASRCVDTDATLVARLGDGFALLREDVPGLDDPDRKKKEREAARARPPARKPKGKKSKPTEVRVKADPKKVELYAKRADATLATTGEWATTGLVYQTPLGGLGLVAAIGGASRVRALYYEYGGASREKSRDVLGEARLALGSLDERLEYDPQSAHKMKLGKLYFGFVDEHQNPRLVASERGVLYLGQVAMRGRCEVAVASPFVMPLVPSQEDCALAPQRFFDFADAARARQRNKPAVDAVPLDPAVREQTGAIRAYGQSASDPLRVAGFGKHQFGLTPRGVFAYVPGGAPAAIDAPFAGARELVVSGAFAPDGSAYVETTRGDVILSATHEVIARTPRDRAPRGDVVLHERRAFSKIAGAWVPRRGRHVARLRTPGPMEVDAVLVGGEARGLRLSLHQGILQVDASTRSGAASRLAAFTSPVTSGFDAVERPGGGALIVGTRPSGEIVAFTLDAAGKAGAVVASGVKLRPHVAMRLTPLATGGAVVADETETTFLWVSDTATWLGRATAGPRVAATCGVDPPSAFPLATPGALTSSRAILGDGCYAGDFGFDASGTLLVLGEVREGAGRRAAIFPAADAASIAPPAPPTSAAPATPPEAATITAATCPTDMVHVPATPPFCVDRYESSLIDLESSDFISPDGPPTPNARAGAVGDFATRREIMGDLFARAFPLPDMRDAVMAAPGKLAAVAVRGAIPSGFVSGTNARAACAAAGKRLCSRDEWKTACRGEENTLYPYGDTFVDDACNVNGDAHPAYLLHGHASMGHLDPRLNRVVVDGRALLERTGARDRCASRFGDDAIFDMVGNLDEWVDDKNGAFAGGFYARKTTNGCEAVVDAHPNAYFDYSTGVRCCASL